MQRFKDERRLRGKATLVTFPPTKTQQQFEKDANINIIMSNYKKGILPEFINKDKGISADLYAQPQDLVEAYDRLEVMKESFGKLPAHVREKFRNSPRLFVEFVGDPANKQEVMDLFGIRVPAPAPAPEPAPKPTKKSAKAQMDISEVLD